MLTTCNDARKAYLLKGASGSDNPPSVLERFSGFLEDLTGPLFSGEEQEEIVLTFHELTHECLSDYETVEAWISELCPDGIPMEFSLAVDANEAISLRFIVDGRHGPQPRERSINEARRRADVVVPGYENSGKFIDRLFRRHLEGDQDESPSFVAHGARFTRNKPRAGRLYFPTWGRSVPEVYEILADVISEQDLELLRSSSLGETPLVGVGYDFGAQGLGRVKIYQWIQSMPEERCRAIAEDFLGYSADPLIRLVNMIAGGRHPLWVIPQTLIGVGFRPEGGYRDLKVCLPVTYWDLETFRDIGPYMAPVFNQWGIPFRSDSEFVRSRDPHWYFVPTWLSVDASPKSQSLSLYFKPTRRAGPHYGDESSPKRPRTDQGDTPQSKRPGIFQEMFEVLLESDAADIA